MKKRYVTIYGGAGLTKEISSFVEALSYTLLDRLDIVMVTGGFYSSTETATNISTDVSALNGARRFVKDKNIPLADRFETWLPDPEMDRLREGVDRFKEGNVRELKGDSPYARRFAMVRDTDVIITISGRKHTATVLGFAEAMNKPALPIASTGGDSNKYWKEHHQRIKKRFAIDDAFARELEDPGFLNPEKQEELINRIVNAVEKGLDDESANNEWYKKRQRELLLDVQPPKLQRKAIAPPSEGEAVAAAGEPNVVAGPKKAKQYKVFLSYSHRDEKLKDEFIKHLAALSRSQLISVWNDRALQGGQNWDDKIKDELKQADIILLLISADFIASEYIWKVELTYAIDRHKEGKTKVIPIFLRRVFFEGMPFEHLQGYPKDAVPVTEFEDTDKAFYEITKGIARDIKEWNAN
jgi:hypothetical protein